jgi:hypothetical protein
VDDTALAVIIAALSIAPLPLLSRCVAPRTPPWKSVLASLGATLLAVSFFWLWHWAHHPVLAYLDAILYGLIALLAPLVAVSERVRKDNRP